MYSAGNFHFCKQVGLCSSLQMISRIFKSFLSDYLQKEPLEIKEIKNSYYFSTEIEV